VKVKNIVGPFVLLILDIMLCVSLAVPIRISLIEWLLKRKLLNQGFLLVNLK